MALTAALARPGVDAAGVQHLPDIPEDLRLEMLPPDDDLDDRNLSPWDTGLVATGFGGVEVVLNGLGKDERPLAGNQDRVGPQRS